MDVQWLAYAYCAALWAMVVHLWRRVHGSPPGVGERDLLWTFLAGSGVYTIYLPPLSTGLDRLTGIEGTHWLPITWLSVVSGWTLQRYWAHLFDEAEEGRRRVIGSVWVLCGTLVALTALVSLATRAGPYEPLTTTDNGPWGSLAVLVFIGYMGLAAHRLLHLSRQGARLLDQPRLRRRAHCYVLGWRLAIASNGLTALRVVALELDAPQQWSRAIHLLSAGSLVACQIALFSPGLFTWADWLRAQLRLLRQYHELRPLWLQLHGRRRFTPAGATLADRLYHRVIGIRDGTATLRRYFDATVIEDARARCRERGLAGEEARAEIEAVTLDAALGAKRLGRPAAGAPPALPAPPDTSFDGELRHLLRVARTYRCLGSSPGRSRWIWAQAARSDHRRTLPTD